MTDAAAARKIAMQFRKKPVVISASQWAKEIDHPEVLPFWTDKWVRNSCPQCRRGAESHGRIPTLEGEHIVCPGDWIITGVAGEHYPCKPEIFAATYEDASLSRPQAGTLTNAELVEFKEIAARDPMQVHGPGDPFVRISTPEHRTICALVKRLTTPPATEEDA